MITRLKSFAAFWYDFVVGDDWRIAVGVIAAFAATYGLHRAGVPAWWVVPSAVVVLLGGSLLHATRHTTRADS